ncbi:MAG: efflux RND transporter periplasmic adaptor subunit, partial [Bacteroidaceae bacterium]|nr:efflux RND transporter periplasmic adaptor subunit [Bacteroidaceae bacterium]
MRQGIISLLAVALVCSCSEKKEQRSVEPVKVKTTVVGTTMAAGSQAYSGTIEEQSGTTLSFASVGTVQSMCVDE